MSESKRSEGDGPSSRGGVTDRMVIDAIPLAVIVTDPDGHVLVWNLEAERLYGWSESEVVGRSVIEILAPPAEASTNVERLAFVADGNASAGDRMVVDRSGTPVWIASSARPLVDADGATVAIVGASENVGEARAAAVRNRELADHFSLALSAGGLGTWRWNIATGETVWDERLEALFGLAPGGFDNTFAMYVSLMHPDDREEALRVIERAVRSRSSYRVEHRVVWPDGSVHWIAGAGGVRLDEHGAVVGTVGCCVDVTERVLRDEERARHAEIARASAERERVQRERLEFMAAINDALNASSDVDAVMRNVTECAVPRLGDWCSIHLVGDGRAAPRVAIAHVDPGMVAFAYQLQRRFPYDPDAPAGVPFVIRTGTTEFYPDIDAGVLDDLETSDEERALVEQLALRSAIVVPLVKRDRILGAMQFVMANSSRRYTTEDVSLAESVAGRIASSLENIRLNEHQRSIATTLQRSLLPGSLPAIPGIEIAVRYWPAGEATEVGGDFYDVFALEDRRGWAIVIGDVCGTGPAAASLTGLARHSIRAAAWHGDTPTAVLESLNRAVQRSGTGSFLTAAYATLDDNLELTVTCGGHPLPVLVHDGTAATIGTPGTLLGLLDDVSFHPRPALLAPGDVVVFYTDGATDLRAPHALQPSDMAQIVELAARRSESAEAVADAIRAALESVLSFDRRNDDVALLVLQVATGDPPGLPS